MENRIYTLKRGEQVKIAKLTNLSEMTISKALRGIQCSVATAKKIENATKGRVKATVLLGLATPRRAA